MIPAQVRPESVDLVATIFFGTIVSGAIACVVTGGGGGGGSFGRQPSARPQYVRDSAKAISVLCDVMTNDGTRMQ